MAWNGAPVDDIAAVRAGALSTTTTSSGTVTLAHGGPATPISVQVTGRNSGWVPYLIALDSTTITVRFLSRADGSPLSSAIPVAFDWACFF